MKLIKLHSPFGTGDEDEPRRGGGQDTHVQGEGATEKVTTTTRKFYGGV